MGETLTLPQRGAKIASKEELRLELLKLVHRHDREPAEVVARAADLEQYVISGEPEREREQRKSAAESKAKSKPPPGT